MRMTMKTQAELAKEIATEAHDGQFRWDGKTPYIAHPAAIVKALTQHFGTYHYRDLVPEWLDYVMATAWLHDVVEDTITTLDDLRKQGVSKYVIEAVDAITKRDGEEYLDYLIRVKGNKIARVVKIEDIKNNMSDLDKKKKKSMYEKYTLALYILNGSLYTLGG